MAAKYLNLGRMTITTLKSLQYLHEVGFLTDRELSLYTEILEHDGQVTITCAVEDWEKLQAGTWAGW